jgi:hypothetical protein
VSTLTAIRYAIFECVKCANDPSDTCGDSCAIAMA